jgi:RNA polymerase sigma factor (sigma-70 family)
MREQFQAFLAGDDAAFGDFYREVNPRISAYCYKLAPDAWQDIVQELWERVIALRTKNSPSFSRRGQGVVIESPLSFLFQVARNLTVDHFRRSHFTEDISDDLAAEDGRATDLETLVLESLERLAFEDRELLVMNIYSGYKFEEIAKIQNRSVDAVWQQASRARKKLREFVMQDAKRLGIALPAVSNTKKEGSAV